MRDPIPFSFEALPDTQLHFVPGLGFGWTLLIDGTPHTLTGGLELKTPSGTPVTLRATIAGLDFTAPVFVLGEERVRPLPPMPFILLFLVFMPMGLIGAGGLLGAAFGGPAFLLNFGIMRFGPGDLIARAGLTLACTAAAVAAWFTVAGL